MTAAQSAPQIHADTLRLELKAWEADFAASHQGQKPTRDDIKQNPDIALKYRAYANHRVPTASSLTEQKASKRSSLKRSRSLQGTQHVGTPPKCQRLSSPARAAHDAPSLEPAVSTSNTPIQRRTRIGPTPQKDGIVLGLFDFLSPPSAEKAQQSRTPSKKREILEEIDANRDGRSTQQTPSRSKSVVADGNNLNLQASSECRPIRLKSPASTPLKRRALGLDATPSRSGPSHAKLGQETPAFLRRINSQPALLKDPMADEDEDMNSKEILWSPIRPRPRPLGRTLSALVQGLRQMEDQQADDDLDILRELERDHPDMAWMSKPSMPAKVLVQDSQAVEMPLGPDRSISSDEDEEEQRAGEKAPRQWKKKGQKRTTRKVNIKPTTAKWKPEPTWVAIQNTDDQGPGQDEGVCETQVVEQPTVPEPMHSNAANGLESQSEQATKISKIRAMIQKAKVTTSADEPGKKSKTKVGALAHMNFRSLKIKNKNSKAKGRGGRFGRR